MENGFHFSLLEKGLDFLISSLDHPTAASISPAKANAEQHDQSDI
jgi:hypothetical protein